MRIRDIMLKRFPTVTEFMTVEEVSRILAENHVSGVPVIDNEEKLLGFISERDIILTFAQEDGSKKISKDIMSKNVLTIEEDTPVEKVHKLFTEHPYRSLPVLRNGKLVGVITRKKIIEHFMGSYY
ncbi:MAG: CBS domain-containing protein [bacterium]